MTGVQTCALPILSSDRRTEEESAALYLQANMSGEWLDRPVDIRVGVRYEETDVKSQALSPAYTGLNWVAGNELSAVRSSEPEFTSLKGDYDIVLPNFDFKMDVTDDIVARFSASKSLTRPNYGDIQGGQTIDQLVRVSGGTGQRGNPNLQPFESVNIDVSFEYYYGYSSYVAVGYFRKDVDNFIGSSSVVEPVFNLPNPADGPLGDEARAATGSTDGGTLYG